MSKVYNVCGWPTKVSNIFFPCDVDSKNGMTVKIVINLYRAEWCQKFALAGIIVFPPSFERSKRQIGVVATTAILTGGIFEVASKIRSFFTHDNSELEGVKKKLSWLIIGRPI